MPEDGVFQLEQVADHLVHEHFVCDTRDHEDHTFCGVMFDVACESELPMEYLELQSVSVRGNLGPMTVWQTPISYHGKHEVEDAWTLVYEGHQAPSRDVLVELKFTEPIQLRQGTSCALYVHSAGPGDDAVVYDNQRHSVSYTDRCIKLLPGMAHLSSRPFGRRGLWGSPWRSRREFVGRVGYGVRWRMWQPEVHLQFPEGFRRAVMTMLTAARFREESPLYLLHDYIVHFIMNKCSWDAWKDCMVAPPPPQPKKSKLLRQGASTQAISTLSPRTAISAAAAHRDRHTREPPLSPRVAPLNNPAASEDPLGPPSAASTVQARRKPCPASLRGSGRLSTSFLLRPRVLALAISMMVQGQLTTHSPATAGPSRHPR